MLKAQHLLFLLLMTARDLGLLVSLRIEMSVVMTNLIIVYNLYRCDMRFLPNRIVKFKQIRDRNQVKLAFSS